MRTHCNQKPLQFQGVGRRRVEADFAGGRVTSDGGLLLLRELAERTGLLQRFSACFIDDRDPRRVEHTVEELVSQRVMGIACGYEDLNDHDELRDDPLLAVAAGKVDPTGWSRRRKRDHGRPLAGKSTLNRFELACANDHSDRYKKIRCDDAAVDRFFVGAFLAAHRQQPKQVVLDFDATDDPLHGRQEGRFFHGYYDCYCYLPLYVFCGDFLLRAKLRPSNIDAAAGAVEELRDIVEQIRRHWPWTEIVFRADSGFAREEIFAWCEENDVAYVVGLAKNDRLRCEIAEELEIARERAERTGRPARRFKDFGYQTLKSWSRRRRVVGKAEHLGDKSNPRFIVTSFPKRRIAARRLYEDLYCARGESENRIKEQQLYLFATRTSSSKFRANQLRLWLSSVAYVLINELRRVGLAGTQLARAQANTIRLMLLRVGGVLSVSVRRVHVALSSFFPRKRLFAHVLSRIRRFTPSPR